MYSRVLKLLKTRGPLIASASAAIGGGLYFGRSLQRDSKPIQIDQDAKPVQIQIDKDIQAELRKQAHQKVMSETIHKLQMNASKEMAPHYPLINKAEIDALNTYSQKVRQRLENENTNLPQECKTSDNNFELFLEELFASKLGTKSIIPSLKRDSDIAKLLTQIKEKEVLLANYGELKDLEHGISCCTDYGPYKGFGISDYPSILESLKGREYNTQDAKTHATLIDQVIHHLVSKKEYKASLLSHSLLNSTPIPNELVCAEHQTEEKTLRNSK